MRPPLYVELSCPLPFPESPQRYVKKLISVKNHRKRVQPHLTPSKSTNFKHSRGNKFAYPIGIKQERVLISAKDASKVVQSLPDFIRSGIERVSFYWMSNPADPYWAKKYNRPGFVSAASDGGKVSFYQATKGMSKEQFKEYLTHEAAHILDSGEKYSNMDEWKSVIAEDVKLAAIGKGTKAYPTEYASTNASEDFAESMMMFLTDRQKFKTICPNREQYLHELTKRLGKRGHL